MQATAHVPPTMRPKFFLLDRQSAENRQNQFSISVEFLSMVCRLTLRLQVAQTQNSSKMRSTAQSFASVHRVSKCVPNAGHNTMCPKCEPREYFTSATCLDIMVLQMRATAHVAPTIRSEWFFRRQEIGRKSTEPVFDFCRISVDGLSQHFAASSRPNTK